MATCARLGGAPANGTAVTAGGLTMPTNEDDHPGRAPPGAQAGGERTATAPPRRPPARARPPPATQPAVGVGGAGNGAVGVCAAMEGLGAAAGLLLGGILVQAVSWRWVFFVNVPVAAIVAALAPRFIPSPKRQSLRLDLPGAVTASAGLGLIVFGLSRAADHGWTDIWTAGPLAAGAAALAAVVLLEPRRAQPLTPLRVLADRNRGGAYMIQALVGAARLGRLFLA